MILNKMNQVIDREGLQVFALTVKVRINGNNVAIYSWEKELPLARDVCLADRIPMDPNPSRIRFHKEVLEPTVAFAAALHGISGVEDFDFGPTELTFHRQPICQADPELLRVSKYQPHASWERVHDAVAAALCKIPGVERVRLVY
ncbi:MAG TPA: hypothetical protein VFZ48_03075 [Candidatus Saccharimonadales bacterium]